ncbi:uncharacterized protein C2orf92 homolog isoform 4-T4 [Dama dama]|uniref:uncharacterized protein C2orf92 homolog isoform X4 n=1 Tax=Dama dama TaxID=30532 RepID=UPI002A366FF3|nr:uncharacterized protein C2orf92 homolog isoform X4 [Dama dama]
MEPGNFLLRFATKTPKQLTGPGKSGPEFSPLPSQLWNVRWAQATLKERVKAEDDPTDDQNHNPPHVENISQTLQRLSDVPSRGMPCSQLLQFLQKNIIVAAVSVVGIAVAAVLLLLALLVYVRKSRSLHSPADMTYNIFIMNGKTWWQKSQDKKTKKHAGKQKQLKLNSGI